MTENDAVTSGAGDHDAIAELRHRIQRLHVHSGTPSTRVISDRTGKAISHTTVNGVLRCIKLPRWGALELVVEQLGGDIEEFRRLWIAARDAQHGAIGTPAPEAGEEEGELQTLSVADLFVTFIDQMELIGNRATGVSTGIIELDRLLGHGLAAGQLIIITGRPGVGKSTLALNLLRAAAVQQGLPALLMSFGMTKGDIMERFVSAEALIPLYILRSGQLSESEWTKLARRMGEVLDAPLLVNDSYAPSLRTVLAEARREVKESGVKLVVIDSISQLDSESPAETHWRGGTEISRALKLLALELQVPVVAVSPLGHATGKRARFPRPLEILQELGGMDEDGDIVIYVHRDDQYDEESPRAGETDLIIAKHRNGPTDTITVAAQLHLSRFVEMVIDHLTPPSQHTG